MTQSTTLQTTPAQRLGRIGVWAGELRGGEVGARGDAAAELDDLGYGGVWVPGGAGGDLFGEVDVLLNATKRATVATGILNIWRHEAADVGTWWRGLSADHQNRLMLGVGISHAQLIGAAYAKPLAAMRAYLDKLDAEGIPAERRCLAALGPKMLELSAARSAGAHPYLVTPEHTRRARAAIGPDALLAPEQGVILETDPTIARDTARKALGIYLGLPNYVNNWYDLGFTHEDVAQVSDRLCDALFAWGDPETIAARVAEHFTAGADHVCVQVVRPTRDASDFTYLRGAWRDLAKVLIQQS